MLMLIIFDFDGVLFEASWENLFNAYEILIRAAGKNPRNFYVNLEEFKKCWNPDWRENDKKIGIQPTDQRSKLDELFYRVYNSGLALFPWVKAAIRYLHQKHRLAIFTNRHNANVEPYLKNVRQYFSVVAGCEDVRRLKPDPEGINFILRKTGMPKVFSLMIGDTVADINAGKNAGIQTGAVKWGLGDWNDLLAENPDYKFKNWNDLLWI